MKRSGLEPILAGSLGYFWLCDDEPYVFDETLARPGRIERRDRGISVKLLVDDVPHAMSRAFAASDQVPAAIVGVAEHIGVVVLDIVGSSGGKLQIMGARASTEGFIAQTVITSPDVLSTERPLLTEAAIRLRGTALFDWAHTQAYESETRLNPDTRRVESATLQFHPVQPQTAPVRGLGQVTVQADWSLATRTEDGVAVDLALEVIVRASRPRTSRDLLQRLGSLQVLISALFDGFVVAGGGWARMPGLDGKGALWNAVLMRDPTGTTVKPRHPKALPLVDLPGLGGVPALSRWLRLADQHPRALAPIVNRWRRGRGTPELQLVECAVAIEYWVAAHRRTAKWARASKFWPLLAANRAAAEFEGFVGDRQVWADRLWANYNRLKHDPDASFDPREVALLAESAYILLLALMLDRIAGTKAPSRALATSYRLDALGANLRSQLGT